MREDIDSFLLLVLEAHVLARPSVNSSLVICHTCRDFHSVCMCLCFPSLCLKVNCTNHDFLTAEVILIMALMLPLSLCVMLGVVYCSVCVFLTGYFRQISDFRGTAGLKGDKSCEHSRKTADFWVSG